jgi:hypothetical protein
MGDFNAHVGQAMDIDPQVQCMFEDVGFGVGEVISDLVPTTRHNQDGHAVDEMGRLLLDHLCADAGLFLLNGRTQGDLIGAHTRGNSTLDYALTNASTYSCIESFTVLPASPHSDHKPLECVLAVGADSLLSAQEHPAFLSAPRWDPNLREEYVRVLESPAYWDRVASIESDLDQDRVSPMAAAETLQQVLYDAAVQVFGVTRAPGTRLPSGRLPNRWFKHCKTEHSALKAAIRQGDTHAASQFRKEFSRVKRKWKRHYSKQAQAKMLDDLRCNPKRFWSALAGRAVELLFLMLL